MIVKFASPLDEELEELELPAEPEGAGQPEDEVLLDDDVDEVELVELELELDEELL